MKLVGESRFVLHIPALWAGSRFRIAQCLAARCQLQSACYLLSSVQSASVLYLPSIFDGSLQIPLFGFSL